MNVGREHQIWLHYPALPRGRRARQLVVASDGATGVVHHPNFLGIVDMAAELREYLVAPSPLALGPKATDAREARRAARLRGVSLFVASETELPHVLDVFIRHARESRGC
jgi:hypothetical protein